MRDELAEGGAGLHVCGGKVGHGGDSVDVIFEGSQSDCTFSCGIWTARW